MLSDGWDEMSSSNCFVSCGSRVLMGGESYLGVEG